MASQNQECLVNLKNDEENRVVKQDADRGDPIFFQFDVSRQSENLKIISQVILEKKPLIVAVHNAADNQTLINKLFSKYYWVEFGDQTLHENSLSLLLVKKSSFDDRITPRVTYGVCYNELTVWKNTNFPILMLPMKVICFTSSNHTNNSDSRKELSNFYRGLEQRDLPTILFLNLEKVQDSIPEFTQENFYTEKYNLIELKTKNENIEHSKKFIYINKPVAKTYNPDLIECLNEDGEIFSKFVYKIPKK